MSVLCQLTRVRGIVGNRFFHEQMFPSGQQITADLEMGVRRGGDGCRVHLFGKLFEGSGSGDTEFRGPLPGDCAVGIVNSSELRARQLRVKPGVIFADVADADHAHSRRVYVSFSRNHW
jgi:hypothetical protein